MNCLQCRGPLEFAGGGAYARCVQCLAIYSVSNGALTPVQVQAPGGGNNPQFNDVFAQQLGFPPRLPPQQAAPPLQQSATFSVGGVGVRVTGPTAEGMVQQAKSALLLWLIIGGVVVVAGGITAFIMWRNMKKEFDKDMGTVNAAIASIGASGQPAKPAWDGKSPLTCAGADHVHVEGVTATFTSGTAITANASCQVELVNVNITAPVAIEANNSAHVTVTGGSIKGTTNAAVAQNAAEITFSGTKVEGPTKKMNAGKINGP